MGNRLTKIYTRTGDDGTTGMADGSRIDKDNPRIEAGGTIDELNSIIGLLLTHELPSSLQSALTDIQHCLFDMGGELSLPDHRLVTDDRVDSLEKLLDKLNAGLPALKEFILPGGCPAAAVCHLARTLCRRAERRIVTLARDGTVNPATPRYLNRLSDLLFVMARHLNKLAGQPDVLWQHEKKPEDTQLD